MPLFSSFTGTFSALGTNSDIGAGAGAGGGGGGGGGAYVSPGLSADFSTTTLEITINNPKPNADVKDDRFAFSVAMSDRHIIAGAPYEEHSIGQGNAGKAYVFDSTSGAIIYTWDKPKDFISDTSFTNDYFGYAVGISHDYAIVSAVGEGNAGVTYSNMGRVYVFDLALGTLKYTLYDPNIYGTLRNDFFGESVDITDNYAIVGAKGEISATSSYNIGAAYIYDLSDGSLLYTLEGPNPDGLTINSDNFGFSAALNDTYAIVGAPYEDNNAADRNANGGAAYVYDMSDGSLLYSLFADGSSEFMGWSVAIKGTIAVVGAPAIAGGPGAAYVYNLTDGSLMYKLENPDSVNRGGTDGFGYKVAINDTYAAVSAPYEDDATNYNSGVVYIFDITTGALVNTIVDPNAFGTTAGDLFGDSVAMNDTHMVVGASREDDTQVVSPATDGGKAYLFSGA